MRNKVLFPFRIITASAFLILILPNLIQDGMFTDGVLYAAVARNLSVGIGSFWFPHFSETMFPFFHQQPPLTFGIQAIFFKILGSGIYTERFYSFLTACLDAWIISLIWREIEIQHKEIKNLSWFAILTWITIPVVFWCYSNNMEENTMGIFTSLAVLFIYRGLNTEKGSSLYLACGGLTCVIATLCKGFPGLFPLAIPFIYWIIFRTFSFAKLIKCCLLTTGTALGIYCLMFMNSTIRTSLSAYAQDRVMNSIQHVATEESRLYLMKRLLMELSSTAMLVVLLMFIFRKSSATTLRNNRRLLKTILLFLLIGLCASIPLLVTLEQRRFYLVPAIAFFTMALALFTAPRLSQFQNNLNPEGRGFRIFRYFSIALLFSGLIYSALQIGKTSRNEDELADIYLFGKYIPANSIAEVYAPTWENWALHNYFIRHFNISLARNETPVCKYFIVEKSLGKNPPLPFHRVALSTRVYDLYGK